jgi:RNA polymerase sigma-70 factor (sigma-E family)
MHVARDDEQLLLELYLARYRRFVALAAALCGSISAGEDVVQEAYVRLFAHPRRLRNPDAAEAYLRSVVLNLTRRRRAPADLALLHDVPSATDPAGEVQRRQDLVAALGRLPRRQREAVALRYLLDLTEQQTADALGVAVGTVKSNTSRGLAALAAQLEPDRA